MVYPDRSRRAHCNRSTATWAGEGANDDAFGQLTVEHKVIRLVAGVRRLLRRGDVPGGVGFAAKLEHAIARRQDDIAAAHDEQAAASVLQSAKLWASSRRHHRHTCEGSRASAARAD